MRLQYCGNVVIDPVNEEFGQNDYSGVPRPPSSSKFNVFDGYSQFMDYDRIYLRDQDLTNPSMPPMPPPPPGPDNLDGLDDYDSCDDDASDPMGPTGFEGPDSIDPFALPINVCYPHAPGQQPILPSDDPVPTVSKADQIRDTTNVTEHQLLLLYPEASAFCLNNKQWRKQTPRWHSPSYHVAR